MKKSRYGFMALTGTALMLTAACGGGGDGGGKVASINSPKPSASQAADNAGGSDIDKMRAYAKCMRDHGIDMPDPVQGADGKGASIAIGRSGEGDQGKLKTASDACRTLLPNGGVIKKPDAAQLDKMRKDAKCMREHGVDMPDPGPDGQMTISGSGGMNSDPAKAEAAAKACGLPGMPAMAGVPAK